MGLVGLWSLQPAVCCIGRQGQGRGAGEVLVGCAMGLAGLWGWQGSVRSAASPQCLFDALVGKDTGSTTLVRGVLSSWQGCGVGGVYSWQDSVKLAGLCSALVGRGVDLERG